MNEKSSSAIDITLLVCTYNRSHDLREMLKTAVAQETDGKFTYEILVVDNNSTDDTRSVVEEFIAYGYENLSYMFESQQGKSNALNTGLNAARGSIFTICDDDFILPVDWLKNIFEAFNAHPEVSFVSGKVLPAWQGEAPSWLTPIHWSAIALTDYGEKEFYADENNQICLLACSFRMNDVKAVGGYNSKLGVTKNQIGGMEDFEILKRLWRSGRKGIYLPHIWFHHKVTPNRYTKHYHRKWHTGHGSFYAAMREEEFEKASVRLFDVPAHMYRQAAKDVVNWLKYSLQRREAEAFQHETQLRFFMGFFRFRRSEFLALSNRHSSVKEIMSFLKSLPAGKLKNNRSKEG
jgi:glycosyltransferase involved in cell wall biosynthesis